MAVSVFSLCVTFNGATVVVRRAEKRGGGRQAERVGTRYNRSRGGGRQAERVGTRLQQVTELIPVLYGSGVGYRVCLP